MVTTSTTNLPNGVTNASSNSAMGALIELDPTKVHNYFNDFNLYDATDWVVTTIVGGAGTATQSIVDEDKGVLEITNADSTNDVSLLHLKNETFKIVEGKRCHFKALFRVSGGSATEFLNGSHNIGLQIKDISTLEGSDGIYFIKLGVSTSLQLRVRKDNVSSTTTVATNILFDDINKVAFIYDGKSEIQGWYNDVKISTLDTTNLPNDEELTVSFGIKQSSAVARTMHIDYIYAANER